MDHKAQREALEPNVSAPVTAAGAKASGDLFASALQHHQAGNLAEAERLYRQLLANDRRQIDCLHLLGVVAQQTGRHDDAIKLIRRAIALNSGVASFHNNIGEAYRAVGRFDTAVTHLRQAIGLEPGFAEAHLNLANVLLQQGKSSEAMTLYRQALTLRPGYAEAHMNLGAALMEQGDAGEAVAQYRLALAINPDFAEAHTNLGIALQARHKLDEAVAHHRRALALRPRYAAAHVNLGNALLEQSKLEQARAHFEASLAGTAPGAVVPGAGSPLESVTRATDPTRALNPVQERGFMNLVRVNCWRSSVADWGALCDVALAQEGLVAASRFELLVRKAIQQWVTGDLQGMANTLTQTSVVSGLIGPTRSKDVKNSRAYEKFLRALLSYAMQRPQAYPPGNGQPVLPVVGNSHCLCFSGLALRLDDVTYTTRAHLVMGCKAWHLGNERPTLYKWLFDSILDRLPPRSTAICAFGEIDCRYDEGIFPYFRKTGGDLAQLIAGQVEGFMRHVAAAAARREMRLLFLGVPAPHLDLLRLQHPAMTQADAALLISIVQNFNLSLERSAAASGHRYIDLYRISAGPEGKASGDMHIDDFHLRPDALGLALSAP
jgi:Flp pilus assembly protein TadD